MHDKDAANIFTQDLLFTRHFLFLYETVLGEKSDVLIYYEKVLVNV